MKDFELKLTKVENVDFVNKLPPNTKIELQNKYSYNVGYSKLNTCQGEMRVEVSDKNSPDRFRIVAVMKGYFVINSHLTLTSFISVSIIDGASTQDTIPFSFFIKVLNANFGNPCPKFEVQQP